MLLLDLAKRWVQLASWYTNEGLVPNHTLLWRPSFSHEFSLFYLASYPSEATLGFVVCALVYLGLLLGLYTRCMQLLSTLAVLSLHGRLLLFDNGGDVVLGLLCVWTTFLPTGRVWSIDAALATRPEVTAPRDAPVRSLAVVALVSQLALIYFFNALQKSGETWRDGSAVHYVLHLDRLVTPFGVWLRERMSPAMARVATWSTLALEWTLPWLLLSPLALRTCRRAAIVFVFLLHAGIGLCMNLGVFVPAMLAFTPNLLHGDDWDALARAWARAAWRVRFAAWLARGAATALARGAFLLSPGRSVRVAAPGPVVAALRRRAPMLREATVAALIVVAGNQVLDENQAAHRLIDHHNTPAVAAAVTYLNLFQGWSMFAPDVNKTDLNVAIDAVTVDGRHVDPWNEAANPRFPAPGARIPTGMGTNWLFFQYVTRIPWWPAYQPAFEEWILRYPQRTGRKEDELVSFRAYKVEDDSPPPGAREPTNPRASLMFQYTAPTPASAWHQPSAMLAR